MKKVFNIVVAAVLSASATAQTGKENIDKLCGCFEVTFKYAETFSPDKDYKFHDREKIQGATELALPIINTDKRVVIQHLLVVGNGMVVKHWREDWTYENPVQWNYKGDKVWEKVSLNKNDVKGKWSQSVWEVTDAPRYQGSAPWQFVNGHTIWENTTDAPLPRREYTQRSDYNILNRTNRLVIKNDGYDHVQDNKKVLRADGSDKIIAEEKGLNLYEKADEADCEAAAKYWEEHKGFWTAVQQEWDKVLSAKSTIKLVNDNELMNTLFKLADDWKAKTLTAGNVNTTLAGVLAKHIQ